MAQIIWTTEANQCLAEIHDYIAERNARAAHGVVSGIYRKIQLLRNHPRLGQRYMQVIDREVREILYGHYRIAYLIKSETRIEILGIFHAAMSIERYIQ